MKSFSYFIKDSEYFFMMHDEEMFIGNKIGFLFDKDTGAVLSHGQTHLVREKLLGMIKILSQASADMPRDSIPEELFKEVCDMKEALTFVEIKHSDGIDLEEINKFVTNTGYLKLWYERKFT